MMKCTNELYQQRSGETDEQTLERAMRDPEVAGIMVSLFRMAQWKLSLTLLLCLQNDPVMQSILQQSQGNPRALQDHMKNPMIRTKIQKVCMRFQSNLFISMGTYERFCVSVVSSLPLESSRRDKEVL